MTKLDDLKLLHRDLTQMGTKTTGLMTQVASTFPGETVEINAKLEIVGAAIEGAKAQVRSIAGVETMKNGGTTP